MIGVVNPNPQLGMLVKDSGVLLENFKEIYDEAKDYNEFIDKFIKAMDSEDYLGITRGGNTVDFENETRIIEYDGRRVRSVGDFVVDSATPQINTTLLVQSETNLRRAIPMSDVTHDTETGAVTLRPRLGSPQESDYMDSLSLVKEMVNGDIQVTTLFKAINTAAVSFTGNDKSESEIACTFTGNARDYKDTRYAPVEIITWKREENL
jgi:hypothetical protein